MMDLFAMQSVVRRALEEDLGPGDVTTQAILPQDRGAEGTLIAEETLVLAGLPVAQEVFRTLDPAVQFNTHATDGQRLKRGSKIATLFGSARALLSGERVALNFLQRLSGVATLSRQYSDQVRKTDTQVVDTRKTTPGLRGLEKYAVALGGCGNHRFGLFDAVLIKENHIALSGGITEAVRRAREATHHLNKIEVETGSLEEVREALKAGADVIMLDNMPIDLARKAVQWIRREKGNEVMIEISGRVSLRQVQKLAEIGANVISVGAIIHSARWVDISMDVVPQDTKKGPISR